MGRELTFSGRWFGATTPKGAHREGEAAREARAGGGSTAVNLADRIFDNVTIGGGGADPAKRFVNNDTLEKSGWQGVVDQYFERVADAGCWNFLVNNPGGINRLGWYEFGQMVAARDGVKGESPKLPWLVKDFDTAMARFVRDQAKKGRTIRLIPYIGAGAADAALDPAKTMLDQRTRFRADALAKLLRGGNGGLGLDSLTLIPADSEQGLFIRSLAASGLELYGEGYPSKDQPWTAAFNVVCTQENYKQRTWGNERYADGWGVPEQDIKGRLVVIYDEGNDDGVVPFARRHLAAGRCVSIPMYVLLNRKIPLSALDPAN